MKRLATVFVLLPVYAFAGVGADIVALLQTATMEANVVYVAVIAAAAAYFVVRLIKSAL